MSQNYQGLDLLRDLSQEYVDYKKGWREENNVPAPRQDDEYAQNREQIETLKQVLFRILNDRKIIGEAMLATIWGLFKDDLWRYDSQEWDNQPDTFEQYVELAILQSNFIDIDNDDRRYFNAMRSVVENILSVVYRYEQAGDTIVDENGSEITVDRLISTKGLISKMKEWAFRVGNSEFDPELQRNMIGAIATRTRAQLDEYRDQLDSVPTIDFFVSLNEDGYTIHAEHVDAPRFELMKRLLGRYANIRLS